MHKNNTLIQAAKKLDSLIFGGLAHKLYGKLLNLYESYKENQIVRSLKSNYDYRFVLYYQNKTQGYFRELCDKYGSDKGGENKGRHYYQWPPHTYADLYSRLFDHCRFNVKKVFECGIGTTSSNIVSNMGDRGRPGASLRIWREYFPSAQIIGADIDKNILFEEDRIKTFYLDQTKKETILTFWEKVNMTDFDLMVDDGLHSYEANICLFENSVSRLSKYGIYVIEDVNLCLLRVYRNYFSNKQYQVDYVNMFRPNLGLANNNVVLIRKV